MRCSLSLLVLAWLSVSAVPTANAAADTSLARVAILDEAALGVDAAVAEALRSALRRIEVPVRMVNADALCDAKTFSKAHIDLLIMPAGKAYPVAAMDNIRGFLRAGGGLIVLGGPPFSCPFWKRGGEWVDWDGYVRKAKTEEMQPDAVKEPDAIFDFARGDPGGWSRNSNAAGSPAGITIRKGGDDGGKDCLVYHVTNLTGWDVFGRAVTLPPGPGILCVRAKGETKTPQFSIELVETDGSRWIAVVNLTEKWETHVLRTADFKFWKDGSPAGRGKPGDAVRFERVNRIAVGLAFSHTNVGEGEHTFRIQEIGVPRSAIGRLEPTKALVLDGISPPYKLFPVTQCSSTRVNSEQALVRSAALPASAELFSCAPRPQGTGIEKGRKMRFVPLILALDKDGKHAGNAAWLFIDKGAVYRGSWACFGFTRKELYKEKALADAVADLARRMRDGIFLYEGGSQYHVYFRGESVKLGAEVVNLGMQPSSPLTIRVRVTPEGVRDAVYRKDFTVEVPAGKSLSVADTWSPGRFATRSYSVRTELIRDGNVMDMLCHELRVWEPKPIEKRVYMTTKDGDFYLGGRKWYAHGINYMPSSDIATEDGEYFEHYLGARSYDPVVIEQDLTRIVDMGMNMVSIFVYHPYHRSRNVLDLIMRCDRRGLKVNLSLRPHADPMMFSRTEVREMIEELRLAEEDAVFAYDIAWERQWGNYKAGFDGEWERWVVERYGSIANAEKDWGVSIPRSQGKVAGPSDGQLRQDGDWRRMAAAYRRFADNCSSKKHAAAARMIRSIDPNHLVSFRMNVAGNPASQGSFPYDFRALKSLDLMEPEAYGSNPELAMFTGAYARYTAPGRPVFWAELGLSIWAGSNFVGTPPAAGRQASLFSEMYDMMLTSYVSGSAGWFYPGGFRFNENSDYGVINPDGSWRPVSEVIRKYADRMTAARTRPAIDHWITVDRDADARGLAGIYDRVKNEYWQAVKAGKFPGLRDEGTGTDSTDVPLKAVGNTDYNGNNPPKYLDAEFNYVRVRNAEGAWTEVENGARIKVKAGAPIMCLASVGNLQSATWIAPGDAKGKKGAVCLAGPPGFEVQARGAIAADTPYFADAEIPEFVLCKGVEKDTRIVLQMTADGRAWFGEKIEFTLTPLDGGQ